MFGNTTNKAASNGGSGGGSGSSENYNGENADSKEMREKLREFLLTKKGVTTKMSNGIGKVGKVAIPRHVGAKILPKPSTMTALKVAAKREDLKQTSLTTSIGVHHNAHIPPKKAPLSIQELPACLRPVTCIKSNEPTSSGIPLVSENCQGIHSARRKLLWDRARRMPGFRPKPPENIRYFTMMPEETIRARREAEVDVVIALSQIITSLEEKSKKLNDYEHTVMTEKTPILEG